MKPRLTYRRSVWSCCRPDFMKTHVIGFGYTPAEAYDDWKRRLVNARCGEPARWTQPLWRKLEHGY
jgi:hypothetical protein